MQGDLWRGYPEYLCEVVEVRTDPNIWWYGEDGEKQELVLYVHTIPIKPLEPDTSTDPLF